MTAAPPCRPDADGACAICRDEGQVGAVVELLDGAAARVRVEGGEMEVALDLLDGVRPGDRVLVHLGFALARVEEGRP